MQLHAADFILCAESLGGRPCAPEYPLHPSRIYGGGRGRRRRRGPAAPARAAAKYTRYNVTSPNGQKALASYAKGVDAMLKLPADHPQNWFRNAFIHLMDCPHGNWWFYAWHRGYLGFFEQTIRALSGDDTFALPYWDWTQLPQIPDAVFDGVSRRPPRRSSPRPATWRCSPRSSRSR